MRSHNSVSVRLVCSWLKCRYVVMEMETHLTFSFFYFEVVGLHIETRRNARPSTGKCATHMLQATRRVTECVGGNRKACHHIQGITGSLCLLYAKGRAWVVVISYSMRLGSFGTSGHS